MQENVNLWFMVLFLTVIHILSEVIVLSKLFFIIFGGVFCLMMTPLKNSYKMPVYSCQELDCLTLNAFLGN